ncbi:MAG: N-acetylglucosamine-6-phosphate deacetylase [Acidobacteriaceae bacterium]
MRSLLTTASLVLGDANLQHPWLLMEDGIVTSLGARSANDLPEHDILYDFPDAMLAPALLDIHIHGAIGHDVMEATPAALGAIGRFLSKHGTGAYLATTVTAPVDATLRALEGLATMIEGGESIEGAQPLGIHLEGPFLSHAKRGVHPAEHLQPPSVALFNRFWEAAQGKVKLITIAPEVPGALELIHYASSLGVRVSLGHSDGTAAEARAGIEAGARSATHTFNAMHPLEHREPGIVGAVLDDDDLFADIICDGMHVDPAIVRLFAKAKGASRGILITDALSATGMPNGHYTLGGSNGGGLDVEVVDGRCVSGGVIAGSVLTLDRAVRNFASFTRAALPTALRLATRNPAELLGIARSHGSLAPGSRADVAVFSSSGEVLATFLGGKPQSV